MRSRRYDSLTFRFAEFIAYLGGIEQINDIVNAGVIIAVVAHFWLGQAIDCFGTGHLRGRLRLPLRARRDC